MPAGGQTLTSNGLLQDPGSKDIGKHPRTRNGLTDATTDGEILPGWSETCPDAIVGIRTGRGSHGPSARSPAAGHPKHKSRPVAATFAVQALGFSLEVR